MIALIDWGWLKAIISIVYAATIELVKADVRLIAVVSFLVLIDLVTGVMAAVRRGERIRSLGMRQTIVKVIEYALLLLVFSALANSFSLLYWMQEAAFAYVALTEAKSIVENLYGPGNKVWQAMQQMRKMLHPGQTDSDVKDKPDQFTQEK